MPRLEVLLAAFLPIAFFLLVTDAATPAALAAGLVIILSICVLPAPTGAPTVIRTIALRDRARRSVFLRLRDPDASGRPRPRAPGTAATAA